FQSSTEGAATAAERAVAGQRRGAVAAGEVGGAGVARCRVVELVLRCHGEVEGAAGGGAAGGADREVGGSGGADGDAVAGAGDAAGIGVGGGQRLAAGRLERGAERAGAARERTVIGQDRLAVAAGEVHSAAIARRGV